MVIMFATGIEHENNVNDTYLVYFTAVIQFFNVGIVNKWILKPATFKMNYYLVGIHFNKVRK